MLETVVSLGLLLTGLIGFEGVEIMMQRQEHRSLQRIQAARQRYEAHYPVVTIPANHA